MKSPAVYLHHIRDAIREIQEFTAGGEDAFRTTPMIQAAVIRNLELIGEATKRLPTPVPPSGHRTEAKRDLPHLNRGCGPSASKLLGFQGGVSAWTPWSPNTRTAS